jgi:hypothetical protein
VVLVVVVVVEFLGHPRNITLESMKACLDEAQRLFSCLYQATLQFLVSQLLELLLFMLLHPVYSVKAGRSYIYIPSILIVQIGTSAIQFSMLFCQDAVPD